MITFGITGNIASGKSTVTKILTQQYEIPVVDADVIAREVVEPGKPCLEYLVNAFSNDILNEDGTLNRKHLGDICFNNKIALDSINRIMGPPIREESFKQIQRLHSIGHHFVGYDSALIIESNIQNLFRPLIVVYCSPEIQLSRLIKRNNLTLEEAKARVNSQLPLKDKVSLADFVINNDNGVAELASQIFSVVNKLKQL